VDKEEVILFLHLNQKIHTTSSFDSNNILKIFNSYMTWNLLV